MLRPKKNIGNFRKAEKQLRGGNANTWRGFEDTEEDKGYSLSLANEVNKKHQNDLIDRDRLNRDRFQHPYSAKIKNPYAVHAHKGA